MQANTIPSSESNHRSKNDHVSNSYRVVVTGMGAITPLGNTVAETWDGLIAGRSGAGRITLLDASPYACQIGCELKGFEPTQFIPRKKARHMSGSTQLSVIAAGQAIEDAALDLEQIDRDKVGVITGTSGGNTIEETERATIQRLDGNSRLVSPFQFMKIPPNMSSFFIAETYNLRGYNLAVCTACAASTQAIGEASNVIMKGEAEVMIAGGCESVVSVTALAGFTAMRAFSTGFNDEPQRAMRPFDAGRDGFIPGIGGAFLVLESRQHALARGARIYAEVLGYGVSNDAFHMIAPDPDGSGAALAIRRALSTARIQPEDVDYINAHAASTPLGDLAETKAIKSVFGKKAYEIPISSTKSMIGHLLGAAGAVEAVACVKTLNEGIIHPTINYETADPDCDLDYVPNEAREEDVKIVMSNSFGLGGQNACLVLGEA